MALKIRRSDLVHRIIYWVGKACFRGLYRLKIEGQENIPTQGPCLILPKHQFWTDIPIVGIAAVRPLYYIAKQELFENSGMAYFIRILGGIPVDRKNPVKSLDTFRFVDEILKKGEYLVLFPEGTYYPYCIGQGKHRLIQRILRFQEDMDWRGERAIPFVPMGIDYEKKKFRPEVRIRIGPPLYSNGEADGPGFTRRLVDEIGKLSNLT